MTEDCMMKARGTLLMALLNKDQPKFHSYKDAKLLMEAIEKSSETMDYLLLIGWQKTYISQLGEDSGALFIMDMNLKLLRSLPSEWKTHALIWRNKAEIETISLDDLYNNLKIYEPEKINLDHQNNQLAYGVRACYTQSNPTSGDNLSDAVICAFLATREISSEGLAGRKLMLNGKELDLTGLIVEWLTLWNWEGMIRATKLKKEALQNKLAFMAYTSSRSSSSSDSEGQPTTRRKYKEKVKVKVRISGKVYLLDFKLLDEKFNVLLVVPRKDIIYSVDLIECWFPTYKGVNLLFAKATIDESNFYGHWNVLGHINFKNMENQKRVRGKPWLEMQVGFQHPYQWPIFLRSRHLVAVLRAIVGENLAMGCTWKSFLPFTASFLLVPTAVSLSLILPLRKNMVIVLSLGVVISVLLVSAWRASKTPLHSPCIIGEKSADYFSSYQTLREENILRALKAEL
ncbi:hypothetical protein Tco_0651125 [Tanacetum coccineum]